VRIVALSVIALVTVDPLLVSSIGFWLSVGATLGVTTVGPWLARRLHRLGPLALPAGITLGAQLGVALPALLVFQRLPLVSLPANVLAVPVAGVVMLYGLPAGLVAANVPAMAGAVMAPVDVGVRWVDTVAIVASALEPPAPWVVTGWVLVGIGVAAAVWHGRGSS
jgi:competence protein ComEC